MINAKKVQLLRFLIGRLEQNMADGNYNHLYFIIIYRIKFYFF